MICLQAVQKYYRHSSYSFHALKDIHLTIEAGDFIAITGSSGSGKSTLINLLGLLDNNFEGLYRFNDVVVNEYSDDALATLRGSQIGFVFQQFHLIDHYTVLDNILLPFLYQQQKPDLVYIKQLLDKMGLADKIMSLPRDLSGGQKQRVAIIRSLATKPQLIIADEPTGALDSQTRDDILAILSRLNKEQNITICLVTHDPDVAKLASKQFIIVDGQLTEKK